ncbi:MAG: NOP5/NOP56 family protein [Candidatus Woesearchaeota archaeon]|jgi:nucleolar protein 56|nr:NOP5/NOP56 family protein [Candidatus Woesearchaeota archaeon]MDP7622959.1 NOP5/NOP56 family protein [Candidatus Woesearchaeota archaeon]HJN57102.1 NOP5/NOP56 family protein [Candidatus Woesearchaeota archaeon]|tara:strand:- start:1339 stop:2295 length:957 start_codon:yes stop_codon:yes gene_type:complete
MPKNYIFTNVIGTFIFNEKYKITDGLLFKDIEHYKNKKIYEEKLIKKHGDVNNPDDNQLCIILDSFKNRKYFSQFYKKNLELTKFLVKESVNTDSLIMQTINTIEEIDKTLNMHVKRLREWYSLYAPEISNKAKDHEKFVSLIIKKQKKQLLKELNLDEKDSMGADLRDKDVSAMMLIAAQVNNFYKLRDHYANYLAELEKEACPNLAAVVGIRIAAKLIEHVGSLKKLAQMPASTIQILGAEKALFRHLKNKKNRSPKYGLLHEHQLIQKSKKDMLGKAARTLADKASIAVKVDYFKGKFIGDKLKKEIISKFKVQY